MKKLLFNKLTSFVADENAQAMVEYVLLAFMFALATVGALELMKRAWVNKWNNTKNARATGTNINNARDLLGLSLGGIRGIGP
jgi:Flp pilus assembly pilin Flp